MIDLNRLRHFVVVVEAGSYAEAAAQLHLSQPALSRSIQALERQYGAAFFDRGRSGATLTPFGRQFLARAQDLLPLFGEYPDVRLTAVLGTPDELARHLLDGDIEFFISRRDHTTVYERVDADSIGKARACFLVREGHPLLGSETVPVAALAPYPRLAPSAWNATLNRIVAPEEVEPLRATVEIDNFEMLADVAARGDAILVSTYGNTVPDLVPLPVDPPTLAEHAADVGFFTLRGRTLSPAAEAVGAILRTMAVRIGFVVPALS